MCERETFCEKRKQMWNTSIDTHLYWIPDSCTASDWMLWQIVRNLCSGCRLRIQEMKTAADSDPQDFRHYSVWFWEMMFHSLASHMIVELLVRCLTTWCRERLHRSDCTPLWKGRDKVTHFSEFLPLCPLFDSWCCCLVSTSLHLRL